MHTLREQSNDNAEGATYKKSFGKEPGRYAFSLSIADCCALVGGRGTSADTLLSAVR